MSDNPKRKRSPKRRLHLLDWRWRLLILVAIYGFIMLPTLITTPLDILLSGLMPFSVPILVSFGMGYVIGWTNKRLSNPMSPIPGCLAALAVLIFMMTAGALLILSSAAVMVRDNLHYLSTSWSLNLVTFWGVLLLPMPLAIHIGMAGERLAIRNYHLNNQPEVKRKREYDSGERLSDEYDAGDDSFDISEANEEQQKFNSLEG